jgi:hypothetical protein
MDSKPLEYKFSGGGGDIDITIKRDSLFANFPIFERMLSVGSIKDNQLKSLQQVTCSVEDSATMKCSLAEFWTASTYRGSSGKIKSSKNTYSENRYTEKKVLFTRIAAVEKGE